MLVSLATLYMTQFNVVHSLKVTYVGSNPKQIGGDSAIIVYRTVFQNHGTRSEAVVNTSIFLTDTLNNKLDSVPTISDTPFLVPSKDATVRQYKYKFRIYLKHDVTTTEHYNVVAEYRVTGHKGIVTKVVPLTEIRVVRLINRSRNYQITGKTDNEKITELITD